MPINTDRILTTHVGSLPRTDRLREANARRQTGDLSEADFQQILFLTHSYFPPSQL